MVSPIFITMWSLLVTAGRRSHCLFSGQGRSDNLEALKQQQRSSLGPPRIHWCPGWLLSLCSLQKNPALSQGLGSLCTPRIWGGTWSQRTVFRGTGLAQLGGPGPPPPPAVALSAQVPGVPAAEVVSDTHLAGWALSADGTLCLDVSSRVWRGSYGQVKALIIPFIHNSGPVAYSDSYTVFMNKDGLIRAIPIIHYVKKFKNNYGTLY